MSIELFEAAEVGNVEQIIYWLDQGADINFKNPHWREATPLFAAVKYGHEKAVDVLIRHGADVHALNRDGWGPVHMASETMSPNILKKLLSAGESIETKCIEITENQEIFPNDKLDILAFLHFASTLDSVNAMYFLPILYADVKDKETQIVKNDLLLAYINMDEALVDEKLALAYQLDAVFHLQAPDLLKKLVHRYGLARERLERICYDLLREDLKDDANLLITLSQIIKYSSEKGNFISPLQLIKMIECVENTSVKYELIWAIVYVVKQKGSDKISEKDYEKLEPWLIKLDHPAKHLFEQPGLFANIRQDNALSNQVSIRNGRRFQKPVASASKQLQASKVAHKTKQEEAKLSIANEMDKFKNKKKRGHRAHNKETIPSVANANGSDRSFRRTTYQEVEFLYKEAHAGRELKSDDINEYLPNKFLNHSFLISGGKCILSGGTPARFFIDRMLCATFCKVSNRQALNQKTFDKLIRCVGSVDDIKRILFGTSDQSTIANEMINASIWNKEYTGSPRIVSEAANRLHKDLKVEIKRGWFSDSKCYIYNSDKVLSVVRDEIEGMRLEAMTAIYHSVKRNQGILKSGHISAIENCLKSSNANKQLKKMALKTLDFLGDRDDIDYKCLFDGYLTQLKETKETREAEEAISYIRRQINSKNTEKVRGLFTPVVIEEIIKCFESGCLNHPCMLSCLEIVDDYLRLDSVNGLSDTHLERLFKVVNSGNNPDIIESIFKLFLLQLCKAKTLPEKYLITLLSNIRLFSESAQNILILILENFKNSMAFDYNLIAFKLLDRSVLSYDELGEIKFVSRTRDNKASPSIDILVAQMIEESLQLRNDQRISQETVRYLVRSLDSENKQTRIASAKALYFADKKDLIIDIVGLDLLFELQSYTRDPVSDVSVYITSFYVRILLQYSQLKKLIPQAHFNFLAKIYLADALALGDVDYSKKVNSDIVKIIHAESQKHRELDHEIFGIFIDLFQSENGVGDEEFKLWLGIFEQHVISNKYHIPEAAIEILENYLSDENLSTKTLGILMAVIRNRQTVSERTLNALTQILLESDDPVLRKSAFECLSIADIHQDLPLPLFNVLEMERAAERLSKNMSNQKDAWHIIETAVKQEKKLPQSVLEVLVHSDHFEGKSLEIYKRVVINGQPLPSKILARLINEFESRRSVEALVNLFFHLVKNNYQLPELLLRDLETAMVNPRLAHQILPIFLLIGRRGIPLSDEIMRHIFSVCRPNNEKIKLSLDNKQSCVDIICIFLLKTKSSEYMKLSEDIFIESLKNSQSTYMIKSCLKGLEYIKANYHLSFDGIEALVKCVINNNDKDSQKNILPLLAGIPLSPELECSLALSILDCDSDEEYLEQCVKLAGTFSLLDSNFLRITQIIATKPDLQYKALTLIHQLNDLANLSQKLFSYIKVIALNAEDASVKNIANQILIKTTLKDRTSIQDDEKHFVLPLPQHWVFNSITYAGKQIKHISSQLFGNLIARENAKVDAVVGKNADKNTLLKLVQSDDLNVTFMQDYKKHIPSLDLTQLNLTLNTLINRLEQESLSNEIIHLILESVLMAVKHGCDLCIVEPVFSTFFNSPDAYLRDLSFEGFLFLKNRPEYQSDYFEQLCCELKEDIATDSRSVIEDVEILHAIQSVEYISFPHNLPFKNWVKAILISDWCEKWGLSDINRLRFYQAWSEVADHLKHPNQMLMLLHRVHSISFTELMQIIRFLPVSNEEEVSGILTLIDRPYKALRRSWLKRNLLTKISNQMLDNQFIENLIERMVEKTNSGVAEKILLILKATDNLFELNDLLDFVEAYPIEENQIDLNISIKMLQQSLQAKLLSAHFQMKFHDKLDAVLTALLSKGWLQDHLNELIKIGLLDKSIYAAYTPLDNHREINLFNIFYFLDQYDVSSENLDRVKTILKESASIAWLELINKEMIGQRFSQDPLKKSSHQIIQDFIQDNQESVLVNQLEHTDLIEDIGFINNPLARASEFSYVGEVDGEVAYSSFFRCDQPISQWDKHQIQLWVEAVKSSSDYFLNPQALIQAIAVIKQANFLLTGFQLTNTQILACLAAFKLEENLGRLLQVQTGEGKTVIISMIAILKVLQNKKVDVITSSPVEAERCAREQKPLYHFFGISVSDNLDRSVYIKGAKNCYKSQVVYGEIAQFQFDTLRDEYGLLGTKSGRNCEEMIGDEIDSILIDDSTKIAKLSSEFSGIDQLQPVYHLLHWRLKDIVARIRVIDGQTYLFYSHEIKNEDGRLSLSYYDKDGSLVTIADLTRYVATHKDISKIGQPICGEMNPFIEEQLKTYFDELVHQKVLRIPLNFKDFVKQQLPKWIKNVIAADWDFQENAEYLVQDELVKPIAFDSNGTIQNSTHWGDGLHQFLQLKHNAALTLESNTTNFLSNMAYVKRYGSRICGLTGTLGPKVARENLSHLYQCECIDIPSACEKQYKRLTTTLASSNSEWMAEVCFETLHEVEKSRGVLIICKTIEDVLSLETYIKARSRTANIKTYTMDGCNQEKAVEHIHPGDIIIATSLAGRGFDIKAATVNQFGGMHVILTYLADDRNHRQAIYRTSRQGKLGSGRQILNKQRILADGYTEADFKDLEAAREQRETAELKDLFGEKLKRVEIKDELFVKFCRLISEIRGQIRQRSRGILQDIVDGVKSAFSNVAPSVLEMSVVAAIEERWAIFLKRFDDGEIALSAVYSEYDTLAQEIWHKYHAGNIIQNPCHHIAIANDLLTNGAWLSDDTEKAMQHFEAAIEQDESASAAAFIGKAWIYLKKHQPNNYKQLAIAAFEKAMELLCDELASLETLQALMQNHAVDPNSALAKQMLIKITLIGSHIKAIEASISAIKRSQRLITLYQSKASTPNAIKIQENITISGIQRSDDGGILLSLDGGAHYSVQFNHLTQREDMGAVDQALKTIAFAFESSEIEKNKLSPAYQDIRLIVPSAELGLMQEFLSADVKFTKLSKLVALEKLKAKKTWISSMLGREASVEVSITFKNSEIKSASEMLISEAIKLVESIQEDHQVSLVFTNANETLRSVDTIFKQLSIQEAASRLDRLQYNSLNVCLSGNRETLLKVFQKLPDIKKLCLIQSQGDTLFERTYNRDAAIIELNDLKDNLVSIKLDNVDREIIEKISSQYIDFETDLVESKKASLLIDLEIKGIDVAKSLVGLQEGVADLHFSHLSKAFSSELISRLRKENIEFITCFDNLKKPDVESLIRKADLTQEEMNVSEVKPISDLYLGQKLPEPEIAELSNRGLAFTLIVNEQNFVPWRSIATVCALGTIQSAAGMVLIMTGFGAEVGMGLMTEGIADFATAIRAAYTRHFTWHDYCKQKAVSLVISATTLGWQKIQDAGTGIKNIVLGLGEEVAEQTGVQVVMHGKAALQLLNEYQFKSLAFQYAGVTVAETSAREVLNHAADTLSHFCFDQVKTKFREFIFSEVDIRFSDTPLRSLILKWLAVDAMRGRRVFAERIDFTIQNIMGPKQSFWQQQWNSVGLPLIKGVLSAPQYLGSSFSTGMRLVSILQGTKEIFTVLDRFHQDLLMNLNTIDQDISFVKLLMVDCHLPEVEAVAITSLLKDKGIIINNAEIDETKLYSLDFAEYKQHQSKVLTFLAKLATQMKSIDLLQIKNTISALMTSHIIATAESQLVAPVTSYLLAKGVNSSSRHLQASIFGYQVSEEISRRSEAYKRIIQSRSALANWSMSSQNQESATLSAEVLKRIQQYADEVEKNKPLELLEMKASAIMNNLDLIITDDPDYVLSKEDTEKNKKLAVYVSGSVNQETGHAAIGHWVLKGTDGRTIELPSNDNNCGYAILSALTGKSIQNLRNELADKIRTEPGLFSKPIEARDWLVSHHVKAANDLLFNGGKKERKLLITGDPSFVLVEDAFNASQAVYDRDLENAGNLERIGDLKRNEKYNVNVGMYRNKNTGNIYIAFEGIEGVFDNSGVDASKILLLGSEPFSRKWTGRCMKEFMTQAHNDYPDAKLSLVGHSRGGLLATFHAMNTGLPAIVFDSPGYIESNPYHNVGFFKHKSLHRDTSNIVNIQGLRNPVNSMHSNYGVASPATGLGPKKIVKGKTVQLEDYNASYGRKLKRIFTSNFNIKHHYLSRIEHLITKYPKNRDNIKRAIETLRFPLREEHRSSLDFVNQ